MTWLLKEVNIGGVYVPPFFVYIVIAFVIWTVVYKILDIIGIVDFVWHRALFGLSIYAIIMSLVTIFVVFSQGA